ncbi:hypothetical protein AciM339_0601 [Aciduliprofundum sp. MAR08-339]|uniref:DUF4064 domain-containing protein n=1 Tax=Aciduliprofundum sp. (strain MAR08-339) TaxID=673860 RepID=UPI0002A4AFBA|nr:hypothetical protein AciM339_0601 [Aciduliprofundum sp. MAR08-339]
MSNEDYPATAFALTLIGAILSMIYGFVYVVIGIYVVVGFSMIDPRLAWYGSVCLIQAVIGGVLGFIGAFMMKDPDKVHTGGVLAIISAFLSVMGVLTFFLLLIGGILALTWKGPEKKAVILPPPPPD